MPIYRLVLKSDAATPEAAAQFISDDTGGAVMHASGFAVIDEGDHWRVPVFSLDGRAAAMPLPRGAVFPSDCRLSEKELDRQINQFDNSKPKERHGFEGAGPRGTRLDLGRSDRRFYSQQILGSTTKTWP